MNRISRGLTLVETLISLFILLSAFVVVVSLFHRSLQYSSSIESKNLAAAFADTVLDDMREWSRNPAQFTGSWSSWNAVTDSAYPDFQASAAVTDYALYGTCAGLESVYPAADRHVLQSSCKRVQLTISKDSKVMLVVHTLIAEPARLPVTVEVTALTPVPSPLLRGAGVRYQAVAKDASGNVIPDIPFQWNILAVQGNASVTTPSRDGRQATLTNVYRLRNGTAHYTGGECCIQAIATVRGLTYAANSTWVNLQP
jgi:Tfp pilus assembly protein PilV